MGLAPAQSRQHADWRPAQSPTCKLQRADSGPPGARTPSDSEQAIRPFRATLRPLSGGLPGGGPLRRRSPGRIRRIRDSDRLGRRGRYGQYTDRP